MLKVALVGVGGISAAHIPAWDAQEDTELTALCDIRPEALAAHPQKHTYSSLEQMLAAEKPDILDICLPTPLHTEAALCALRQGIHVLCEKPASMNPADIALLDKTAAQNHAAFMTAQVLRFWPEYELLRDICQSRRYGKPLAGHMTRLGEIPRWSWNNWMLDEEQSGLVPFDLHIHDLDFMVYAFGTPEIASVRRVKRPEQDYLSVVYDFDGFSVSAQASWYAAPYPFQAGYRFQFEKALLAYEGNQCILYGNDGSVVNLTAGDSIHTGKADDSGTDLPLNLPKSNAYANEIRYFTDCVLENRTPEKVPAAQLATVADLLRRLL